MAVSKYWGDERHKDAIYSVYLKKVRYVPPTGYEGLPHYRPIDPDNHHLAADLIGTDHLQWETIREKIIKAGTLDKLIESLIGIDDKMDTRHFNVFFSTYRAFAKPEQLLDKLLLIFNELDDDVDGTVTTINIIKQSSIKSIFMCWLDMYPEDFYDHNGEFIMLAKLVDFTKKNNLIDLKHKAKKIREKFRKILQEGGLSQQLPSLDKYTFALGYDSKDYIYSQERAKMFDVGKENCVQIAEQLTFWDAALFKELLPYQCQGAIWGRRNKNHPNTVFTVRATIDQFNAVSQRVMTSIVLPECRTDFRAKIIEKWIDIARELRALKNFSSLKAVLSSLQSEPVHRLKSAWALVPKLYISQFKELSSIFDVDENGDEYKAKSILDAEGTAKSSPLKRPILIQNCRRTKSDVNLAESQGTVPYLGSFLTDLVMVDQAYQDLTDDGLINFEKRRKEFEILAKIKLFQSAARAYTVPMDKGFCAWFYYLPSLNENECFKRSLEIENSMNSTPDIRNLRSYKYSSNNIMNLATNSTKNITKIFNNLSITSENNNYDKNIYNENNSNDSGIHTEDSIASNSSNEIHFNGNNNNTTSSTFLNKNKMLNTCTGITNSITAPSTPVSTISWRGGSEFNPYTNDQNNIDFNGYNGDKMTDVLSPHNHVIRNKINGHHSSGSQVSNSSTSSSHSSCNSSCASPGLLNNNNTPNFHLARVGLDDSLQTEPNGANYKVIKVENGDRMIQLIERALEKHMLNPENKNDFYLVQLLPDASEFRLPDHCNPYYAVAPDPTSPMLNFLLKKKTDEDKTPMAPSAKKLNRMKRSNLLRWSSGYL